MPDSFMVAVSDTSAPPDLDDRKSDPAKEIRR